MHATDHSVLAPIPGLYEPGFAIPSERILIDVAELARGEAEPVPVRELRVQDARALQADTAPAEFFARYGFVLLPHRSAVTDWNTDEANTAPGNQVAERYAHEVEALIRQQVLPDSGIAFVYSGPAVIVRSAAPDTEPYAYGVHQDFGLTADEYQTNLTAFAGAEVSANWRAAYERSLGGRFVALSFWRPISMTEPLRHMPLALCDPRSVRLDDLVPTGLVNFTPTGAPSVQMGLRHHPDQRWYYYPHMTPDEVLVINQFDIRHNEPPALRSCFHTAFEHPDTPADAQLRQSCEYRPQVFF